MSGIKAIIVDDEDLARMVIREHLGAYPGIRVREKDYLQRNLEYWLISGSGLDRKLQAC